LYSLDGARCSRHIFFVGAMLFSHKINTCNPMGHVLTSGDRNVGHSDLQACMLVDPKEANNYIAETS